MMTINELFAMIKKQDPTATLDGPVIDVSGCLDLRRVMSIPEGVTLSVGGALYLNSLTSLPEGVTLSVGGALYLTSLLSLPAGVTLSAGGYIHGHLAQSWRGKRLVSHDGIVSVVRSSPRQVGDVLVQKSAYFRGEPDGPEHYIATLGEHSAHGKTLPEAIEDVRFKLLKSDPDGTVREIRETQVVTVTQYRAITGACREGCRNWMQSHGVPLETESLPLAQVLGMLGDAYGAEKFREMVGE